MEAGGRGRRYNRRMKAPQSETLFRVSGLVACAIVALPTVAQPLSGDVTKLLRDAGLDDVSRLNLPAVRLLLAALPAATAVLFGLAFWINTRETAERSTRHSLLLMAVQSLIAALANPGYFFIVAAQIPLVTAPMTSLKWLAGQMAGVIALIAASATFGADVSIPEMSGAAWPIAFAVSV